MSTHSYHPDVWDPDHNTSQSAPVLADGCDRCAEIAKAPAQNLDAARVLELHRRTMARRDQISENDLVAARALAVPR